MTHFDHLYRVALHLAKEPDQSQDLVQETYVQALSAYRQFAPGTHLKAWLTRILYNSFFNHYHEKKKWVSVEDVPAALDEEPKWSGAAADRPGPEGYVLNEELGTKISAALKELPEEFRMPIVLVDMGEFSYAEAAEILSCPVGTVRSRLFRGRKILHKRLKGYVGVKEKVR